MRRPTAFLAFLFLLAVSCKTPTYTSRQSVEFTPTAPPATRVFGIQVPRGVSTQDSRSVQTVTQASINATNKGGRFYFTPNVLIGTAGQQLTLTISNSGTVHHNFTLASQKINKDLEKPGSSVTVHIKFPASGFLEFHCEYHETSGMKGSLSVAP